MMVDVHSMHGSCEMWKELTTECDLFSGFICLDLLGKTHYCADVHDDDGGGDSSRYGTLTHENKIKQLKHLRVGPTQYFKTLGTGVRISNTRVHHGILKLTSKSSILPDPLTWLAGKPIS